MSTKKTPRKAAAALRAQAPADSNPASIHSSDAADTPPTPAVVPARPRQASAQAKPKAAGPTKATNPTKAASSKAVPTPVPASATPAAAKPKRPAPAKAKAVPAKPASARTRPVAPVAPPPVEVPPAASEPKVRRPATRTSTKPSAVPTPASPTPPAGEGLTPAVTPDSDLLTPAAETLLKSEVAPEPLAAEVAGSTAAAPVATFVEPAADPAPAKAARSRRRKSAAPAASPGALTPVPAADVASPDIAVPGQPTPPADAPAGPTPATESTPAPEPATAADEPAAEAPVETPVQDAPEPRRPAPADRGRPHWQALDPDFQSETGRYAQPIPSRAYILQTLRNEARPLSARAAAAAIGFDAHTDDDLFDTFERRLEAMVRDGQLERDGRRYAARAAEALVTGKLQLHRDGFGFLIPDGPRKEGTDVFLPARQLRGLMQGDRVRALVTGQDHRGRPEGVVAEIIERVPRVVVGVLTESFGEFRVVPHNARLHPQQAVIPPRDLNGARPGDVVVAGFTEWGGRALPMARVDEVLGSHLDPGLEIEIAVRSHNLPHVFPAPVVEEAEAFGPAVKPAQWEGRADLRGIGLVTIDGADSRDFDDAVCAVPAKTKDGGWWLTVAIADVAAYVRPGTALDDEAATRATSVYFPRQVIPMLPEALSNGLCSLNPNVDRLCMVAELHVLPDGQVKSHRFSEGVMNSQARFTYDEAARIIDSPTGAEAEERGKALVVGLQNLDAVYQALARARDRRGAMDFDTVETKIVFTDDRKIETLVPVTRTRAHRLIEECMIAANVAAAEFVERAGVPTLYRVHARPDAAKVAALREMLAPRGLSLGGGDEPQPLDFAKLARDIKGREDSGMLAMLLLRSQMQARYQPKCDGHFGLGLTHYAHFTSPIRRYPDLLLHRAIKHVLARKKAASFPYSQGQMEALGEHCSMAERRADDASRDVVAWLKCEYMRGRVGESFTGTVTGVTGFGLFVELDGVYVDGLVHVSNMGEYFEFDAKRQRLTASRSGQSFTLGQKVQVKLVHVSLEDRKVDLELEGKGPSQGDDGRQAGQGSAPARHGGPQGGAPRGPAAGLARGDDGQGKGPGKPSRSRYRGKPGRRS